MYVHMSLVFPGITKPSTDVVLGTALRKRGAGAWLVAASDWPSLRPESVKIGKIFGALSMLYSLATSHKQA